ncbi:hypothetical protein AWC38_SpisGene21837 [Stylophora pistillata]|uniref:Uncharacterized protein n=1 Tax=Stylophora pistillata TaxID=50429 RepID=A0A2B4RCC4_STYPI|nr:hypothetical protein AWC38_SpisGene21837 [Stylophora pistillata]
MPRTPLSQEVSTAAPESSQCHASSTTPPMDKVLDVLLTQQKSLEELTSSIRDLKQPRTQHSAKEWSGQRSIVVCFKCKFLVVFVMASSPSSVSVSAIPEILSNVQDSSGIPLSDDRGFRQSARTRIEDDKKMKIEA